MSGAEDENGREVDDERTGEEGADQALDGDQLAAAGAGDDPDDELDDDGADDDDADDELDDDESDEDDVAEASATGADGPERSVDAAGEQGDQVPPDADKSPRGEGDDDTSDETADAPPLRTILEAVLFAAAEPVPLNRLVKLLGAWPRATVKEALDELGQTLIEDGRGLRLAETAGGLQLRSAAECAPWVRRFFAEKPPRLSRAVLETLAIVAYRQPATRGEVEAVRGVNCDAVLGALLTRNLIHVAGRRQSPGRPVEYGTTEAFLELFSLRDLSELPDLPEPEALARLIEEAEAQQALTEEDEQGDAQPDGENPEDPESGGNRVAEGGGGPDPGGPGAAEREGDLGAGDEGGSEQG